MRDIVPVSLKEVNAPVKPILFNTEMVRAILDGRKTVTRRIANINTEMTCNDGTTNHDFLPDNFNHRFEKPTGFVCRRCGFGVAPPHSRAPVGTSLFRSPYMPGDTLYVRETWAECPDLFGEFPQYIYRANYSEDELNQEETTEEIYTDFPSCVRWKPSIHMPKEAARIFLRVKNVRVEHLQTISGDECAMEGVWPLYAGPIDGREEYYKTAFANLWDLTIKAVNIPIYGWRANPWVWVIEFEKCNRPEGA